MERQCGMKKNNLWLINYNDKTIWWDQGFRNFEDTGCSFAPHSDFDDDAGNYGNENPSTVHDEAGPSIQQPYEEIHRSKEEKRRFQIIKC